jgi:hypothetical protein
MRRSTVLSLPYQSSILDGEEGDGTSMEVLNKG